MPSLDSSEDEPRPKKKPGHPKKAVLVTSSDNSDDPEQRKPGPSALVKSTAMSDDIPKPKKKAARSKKMQRPKAMAGSDSDDMFNDYFSVSTFVFSLSLCIWNR